MGIRRLVIADSVTQLAEAHDGPVALAASHGGAYAVSFALRRGVAALLVSDAGVGRDGAGITGLAFANRCGVPCAAIGHDSARIGDGADCAARGVISHVNEAAAHAGIAVGMAAGEAAERLRNAALPAQHSEIPDYGEARLRLELSGGRPVWLLDSAGLVEAADAGAIIVTGSHGGLLGGRPETAIKAPVFAALFNDAGIGIDRAGVSRLPALDARGIAAATVSADSARIGDAASTYRDGVLSVVNRRAADLGAAIGMRAEELVSRLLDIPLERNAS